MAFAVISIARGLEPADHERALGASPPFADAGSDYADLLRGARWEMVERIDVTTAYAATVRRLLHELESRAARVRDAMGLTEFEDVQARKKHSLRAIDDGLVRRELIVAVARTGQRPRGVRPWHRLASD